MVRTPTAVVGSLVHVLVLSLNLYSFSRVSFREGEGGIHPPPPPGRWSTLPLGVAIMVQLLNSHEVLWTNQVHVRMC